MNAAEIRFCVHAEKYEISLHAQKERYQEDVDLNEIEEALIHGEIIEDYPDDPRGPSCLVLGNARGKAIHIVCSILNNGWLRIITVYIPRIPKWINPRQRSR